MTSEHFRLQTLFPAEVSRATQPNPDLPVEEIQEAIAANRVRPQVPEYAAWLITQLSMSVFHHYNCAGHEEPVESIADRVWPSCYAALNVEAQRT